MTSRYRSRTRLVLDRVKLGVLRTVLRPLVDWSPLHKPEDGYTLIIGCASGLSDILLTNLTMIERLDRTNLRQIICVFDTTSDQLDRSFAIRLHNRFNHLPIALRFYSPMQKRIADRVGWGWVYSWLSWSLGIAQSRTAVAFLHDYDAMPLRHDFFEQRYRMIEARGCEYLGVETYRYGEFRQHDQLVATPELAFDTAFVRRHFRPIDLFNRIGWYHGRHVHFDTFLYAQTRAGRRTVLQMEPGDLVHPAQMLCQFTALKHRESYVPPARNTLLVAPYFLYVAGQETSLLSTTAALERAEDTVIPFHGRPMDLQNLDAEQVRRIRHLIEDMEVAVFGFVRPTVQLYLSAIARFTADRLGRPTAFEPLRTAA